MAYNDETVREAKKVYLIGALGDIAKVLELQEASERVLPGSCPNIGRYRDEAALIRAELTRRTCDSSRAIRFSRTELLELTSLVNTSYAQAYIHLGGVIDKLEKALNASNKEANDG